MIELRTEGARSNTVHTWRLYWFHESDLDANYPADAKTLEEAGYVPIAIKTQNKDANKMTEVTKAHRKALFDALDWYPQNQAERDWIETGVGEPPTGSVVGRELVRVARAIAEAEARGPGDNTILYRGSVTDLATDVAAELTPEQATELVQELERFRSSEPGKFLRPPTDPQRG